MLHTNYNDLIPNNVNLSDDRRLKRALESWHPKFLEWWSNWGPEQYQEKEVYLRTAVSVDRAGWAKFGHVRMPDYRWGIFLTEQNKDKTPSGEVLDILKLDKICCRRHMLTHVDIE